MSSNPNFKAWFNSTVFDDDSKESGIEMDTGDSTGTHPLHNKYAFTVGGAEYGVGTATTIINPFGNLPIFNAMFFRPLSFGPEDNSGDPIWGSFGPNEYDAMYNSRMFEKARDALVGFDPGHNEAGSGGRRFAGTARVESTYGGATSFFNVGTIVGNNLINAIPFYPWAADDGLDTGENAFLTNHSELWNRIPDASEGSDMTAMLRDSPLIMFSSFGGASAGEHSPTNEFSMLAGVSYDKLTTLRDFQDEVEVKFLTISQALGSIGTDKAIELMTGYRDQLASWMTACSIFSGLFYIGADRNKGIGGSMNFPPPLEWTSQGATGQNPNAPAEFGGMPGENKDIFGYRELSYREQYSISTGDHYAPRVRSVKGYNIHRNVVLNIAKHFAAGGTNAMCGYAMANGWGDTGDYLGYDVFGGTYLVPDVYVNTYNSLWDYIESDDYDAFGIVAQALVNIGQGNSHLTQEQLSDTLTDLDTAQGHQSAALVGIDPDQCKATCYAIGLTTVEEESASETTIHDDAFYYGIRNAYDFDTVCNMNVWGTYDPNAPDVYIPQEHRTSIFPDYCMRNSTFARQDIDIDTARDVTVNEVQRSLSYEDANRDNFGYCPDPNGDGTLMPSERQEGYSEGHAGCADNPYETSSGYGELNYPPVSQQNATIASNARAARFIATLTLQYEFVSMVHSNAENFIANPERYNEQAIAFNERREADDAFIQAELAAYQDLIQPALEYAQEIRDYNAGPGMEAYEAAIIECAEREFSAGNHATMTEALEACAAVWTGVQVDLDDSEQNMQANRLRDQCALMAMMDDISNLSWRNDASIRSNGLTNTICLENYSTSLNNQSYVVNSLLNNPRFAGFYTLTPEKISALTPYLRFYMVYDRIRSNNDGEETFTDLPTPISVEIPFGNSLSKDLSLAGINSVNDMFKTSHERGYGAGIKSFEWKYFGKNEFTADKDITAKLSMHFPSLSEFLKNRSLPVDPDIAEEAGLDNPAVSFRYSDMAAYAGAVAHMSELSYTLKVTVGWVYDSSQATFLRERFGFTRYELEAIENCFANLILSKIDHTLDIKEDGSVTVNIEYIANAGGILRSAAANVMTDVGMMAFDDAVASVEEEVRKACEGTDGGGRKMLSDLRNASQRVRDKLEIRANSAMVRRLEGNRGHGLNYQWTTGDEILDQKLTEKVRELLANPRQSVGGLSNTNQIINQTLSGDEFDFEPTELPERIFLIKLQQNEINWLSNYGPQWKQQMTYVQGDRVFPNLGPLQGYEITDAQSEINTEPIPNSQLARTFERAEIALARDQEQNAPTSIFAPITFNPDPTDSETGESIAGANQDLGVTNPTFFLQYSIDDEAQNYGNGNFQRAARQSSNPEDLEVMTERAIAQADSIRNETEKYIYYFFYQDLIEVLFSIVKENAAYLDRRDNTDKYSREVERTKVILGNIEIFVPENTVSRFNATGRMVDGEQVFMLNLGDMPISVAYFRQWMIHNVVSRNKTTYYILDFIKDTLRDLVVGPLNDTSCWSRSRARMEDRGVISVHGTVANAIGTTNPSTEELIDPILKLQKDYLSFIERNPTTPFSVSEEDPTTYTTYGEEFSSQPLISLVRPSINPDFPPLEERPVLRSDTSREISNVIESFEFVILYASQITTSRTGNIRADARDGVYHYSIGNNKGIAKNIRFSKAEAPGVREARLEQVGALRNSRAQLMDKYDVELETFGTVAILPGTQIYIDPFGLSPLLGDPSETPERVLRRTQGQSLSSRRAVDLGEASTETFNNASLAGVMGIGGYYIIVEATSYIEAGKYMTKIKAMFDHFGGSAGLTAEVEPANDSELAHQVDCDATMLNTQAAE